LSQDPSDYDTYATRFGDLASSLKDRQDKYYARVLWGNQQEEEYNAWRGIPWTPTKADLGLESLAQQKAIPDGYHHNYDILSDNILQTHTAAEESRQAAVNAQEAADAWRKGTTPNSGPVYPYGLSQRRAVPDGYTFNYGNLETSIKDTHTAAEAARTAAVDAQAAADAWRKGSTPNSGPVLSLNQHVNPADPDNYATRFGDLATSLKDRQDKYYARVLWGNQQEEEANAWRGKPYSPEASLSQRRAIPDGYTFNYGNLETSIKDTHTAAEAARQAAVSAQEAADAWRKGSTPNSGPVLSLHQNPADHDTYDTTFSTLKGSLGAAQDLYEGKRTWGINEQERENAWRGVPHMTKDEDWDGVQSLAQGQPGPQPTDYDKHNDDLADKLAAHNAAWWAEHNAQIAKQSAVDAWRKGSTPNSGPELPYTLSQYY
jgi:soluble cytochrome b562